LGYITPEWMDHLPETIDPDITSISLPINKTDWSKEKIIGALRGIEPETILFLKKLESIEINIQGDDPYTITIKKDKSSYPLVKLSYIKSKEERIESYYWCSEMEFDKPSDMNPEKRKGIDRRPVSVAIPLADRKHKGKFFAYLPVYQETGIPFLINSDFLLASSREGVKEDDPWNLWLRGCIAEVYTKAFLTCMQSDQLSLEQKIRAYASIPMSTKIPFLESVVKQIQISLKEKECIHTSKRGVLQKPDRVRSANNDFRKIFSEGDDIPLHFQKNIQLIDSGIERFSEQLKVLGVKPSLPQDVLNCLEDVEWISRRSQLWLISLYE